jgi:sulfur-carrier protein adenylyltransferase/sulfurtransferase
MDTHIARLKQLGILKKENYASRAFSRNLGLLSESEQLELSQACAAIPGMGGVGGLHLVTLARLGIGKFNLADFDVFEPENVNRQYGARIPDFGKSKLETMAAEALSINPFLQIKKFPQGVTESNLDEYLADVNIVVDSLDFFQFDIRRALFVRAREKGIPVVTAGPIGFSCAMLIFLPGEGLGFDEYFDVIPDLTQEQKCARYLLGLSPNSSYFSYIDLSKVNLAQKQGPSLGSACVICAGMAATETLRLLLKRGGSKPAPYYSRFDPYLQKFYNGYLRQGNRHPLQRLKLFLLARSQASKAAKARLERPPQAPLPVAGLGGEAMRQIIEAGIQAPSGDNVQPWNFKHTEDKIQLYLNPAADPSFFNFRQYASLISCGAVIENMMLSASAHNLQCSLALSPDLEGEDLVADLSFAESDTELNELYSAIWQRCTNRRMFTRRPLLPSTLLELKQSLAGLDGAQVHVLSEPEKLLELRRLVAIADRVRVQRRDLHEYLNQMIRFSRKETVLTADGLPLRNLEAGLAGEIFLRLTRSWRVMNVLNKFGFSRFVSQTAVRGFAHCSAALLITVPGRSCTDYVLGGRALQRVWLSCTKLGLHFQPLAATPLFALRWQLEGSTAFSQEHRELLEDLWPAYQALWNLPRYDDLGQVLLARIGSGLPPTERTMRKPIDEFLLREVG